MVGMPEEDTIDPPVDLGYLEHRTCGSSVFSAEGFETIGRFSTKNGLSK